VHYSNLNPKNASVDGKIRNPALPVMPRHYQQKEEISFIEAAVRLG